MLSRCRLTSLLLRRCWSFAVACWLNTVTVGSSQWNQTGTECGACFGSAVAIQMIGSALNLPLMYASVGMPWLSSGGAISGPNRFRQRHATRHHPEMRHSMDALFCDTALAQRIERAETAR